MMIMKMMGMTPGSLVRALLLYAFKNLLVFFSTPLVILTFPLFMFVVWFLVFLFQ